MSYRPAVPQDRWVDRPCGAAAAATTGRDRGAATIQEILGAVFAIAIVGIVVAASKAYVSNQAALIK